MVVCRRFSCDNLRVDYALLFGAAFLAATILPFYSEALLVLLLNGGADPALLLAAAVVGNTLGALVNWYLGLFLLRFQNRRWFYFKPQQIDCGQRWFNRYGKWSLLFAWLPIVGDALTLIAGVMRVPLLLFAVLVGLGKAARYGVVYLIWNGV